MNKFLKHPLIGDYVGKGFDCFCYLFFQFDETINILQQIFKFTLEAVTRGVL